jgi:dinuclear metal center YbgI/SA1388 family protein
MKKNNCQRDELKNYANQLLEVERFQDYCPNGLQVQGKNTIGKLVTGVTASLALIESAIDAKADAMLVHHGWFWKNDEAPIVGQLHRRLKLLMDNDISLFAYHLPLDAHPKVGNNVQLSKVAGWKHMGQSSIKSLISLGQPSSIQSLEKFALNLGKSLGRDPLVIGDKTRKIKKIAWCTGAAQSYFDAAIMEGVDVFISGEVSEPTFHLAQESGVAYIAAGHHATERFGVAALGEVIAKKFGIIHEFIDIPNPV